MPNPLSYLFPDPNADALAQAQALRGLPRPPEPTPEDQNQTDLGMILQLAGGRRALPGIGAGLVHEGRSGPGERLKMLLEQQKLQAGQQGLQATEQATQDARAERMRKAAPVSGLGEYLLRNIAPGFKGSATAGDLEREQGTLDRYTLAQMAAHAKATAAAGKKAEGMPNLGDEWEPTRPLSKKDLEDWSTATTGKEEFDQALQNYRSILADGGTGGLIGPHAQELKDARNTVMLTYNKTHGINRAPQHEEMKMLESMVPAGAGLAGMTTSLPTITAALNQLEKSAAQNVQGVAKAKGIRARGAPVQPAAAPTRATTNKKGVVRKDPKTGETRVWDGIQWVAN